MADLDEIKQQIRGAMVSQGTYSPDLELFISKFAAVILKGDIADGCALKLKKTYIKEKSREGNGKQVAHPAFKIASDSDTVSLTYFKEACLTPRARTSSDDDEVNDLINDVNEAGKDGE